MDNNALAGLIHRANLPWKIKSTLLALQSFRNHKTYQCNPGYAALAQRIGCDERTARRRVKAAKAVGVLSIKYGGGYTSNSYTFLTDALGQFDRGDNLSGGQIVRTGGTICPDTQGNLPSKPKEEPTEESKEATSVTSQTNPKVRRKPEPAELPDLPASLAVGDLPDQWADWIKYRKEIKKPLTPMSCTRQFRQFEKWGVEKSCRLIDLAIRRCWQGIIEPDDNTNKFKSPPSGPNLSDRPVTSTLQRNEY